MGKPFQKELEKTIHTFIWSKHQLVQDFKNEILQNKELPLFVVGSGGSFSACHYASLLYQQLGTMSKAITPLELIYSKNTLRNSNILFISASGKNTDILLSYETAITREPNRIYSFCMSEKSPLSKLSQGYSICKNFEYKNPEGKDGFLATNSLVAFFTLLFKALNPVITQLKDDVCIERSYLIELQSFIAKVSPDFTFTILYAGWAQPVAFDIESKLAEAALADVLLSDYRNFGHGRHHWFDKRMNNSAIIALITPDEEKLASKTLSFLPSSIPILKIHSVHKGAFSSIDLLIKSFYFIEQMGRLQSIDPGRPGVPAFGSKLYHLNYKKFYETTSNMPTEEGKIAIVRKANVPYFEILSEGDKNYWLTAYNSFIKSFNKVEFGSIVFDYDGTLCSSENRYFGLDEALKLPLTRLLEYGIIIGIATGRGQSVRKDVQRAIPKKYWNQILVGYYNCSDFGLLSDNESPNKNLALNPKLKKIFNKLISHHFVTQILPELKPHQITVEIQDKDNWQKVRLSIIQFIISLNISGILVLESSHSMDIIDQEKTNKLSILELCTEKARAIELSPKCLTIGDKGKWPGNDYQLLSSKYSLSVDEVSSASDSCWNFSAAGVKNVNATLYYLSCLQFNKTGLTLKLHENRFS